MIKYGIANISQNSLRYDKNILPYIFPKTLSKRANHSTCFETRNNRFIVPAAAYCEIFLQSVTKKKSKYHLVVVHETANAA